MTARPGDWTCPKCSDLQFGRNIYCRQCQTPRPDIDPSQVAAEPPPPQVKAPPGATNLYVSELPPDCDNSQLRSIMGAAGVVCDVKVLPSKTPGEGTCVGLVRMQTIPEATYAVENLDGATPPGMSSPIAVKWALSKQEKAMNEQWAAAWNALSQSFGKAGGGGWWGKGLTAGPYGCKGGKGGGCGGKGSMGIADLTADFINAGALPGSQDFSKDANAVYINGLPQDTTELDVYKMFAPFGAIPPQGVRVMFWPDGTCKGYGFVNYLDPSSKQLAMISLNGHKMRDGKTFVLQSGKEGGGTSGQQTGSLQMGALQVGAPQMGAPQMEAQQMSTTQPMGMQPMQSMNAQSMSMQQMMGMFGQMYQS